MRRILTLFYTFLGGIIGFVSNHLTLPLAIFSFGLSYLTSSILLLKILKVSKKLLIEAFITFLLVWLTVWVFLMNI